MRPVLNLSPPCSLLSAALAAPAFAADHPQAQITAFDNTLLSVAKNAKTPGLPGPLRRAEAGRRAGARHRRPWPASRSGPAWAGMTEAQRDAIIQAFTRLTVASYAHNFASFDGEHFTIDPDVVTRGQDKVVQTHLVSKGDPVTLAYRMRQTPSGAWKVIDIYYNGSISQLTTRRSDFEATLAAGGPKALAEHLNAQAEKLLT